MLISVVFLTESCHCRHTRNTAREIQGKRDTVAVKEVNPLDSFYLHGLPESAYPTAFHGQDTLPDRELSLASKQKYIDKSCLFDERQDFGKYYFFIQHIDSLYEYEYEWYYNVWIYDASAKKTQQDFLPSCGEIQ